MKLTDTSIRRPVLVGMVAIGLILFGVIGISRMPVDLFPKVTLPMIVVATLYPGAGPLEVESEVTSVLEEQLGTIPNLRNITSTSIENVAAITLELEWGTNLDAASSDVRDRLDQAQVFLPEDVSKPFVFKFDPSMIPVMNFVLYGDIEKTEMTEIADEIETRLKRVAGVAAVGSGGGVKRQVQIIVDLRELTSTGITLDQFTAALKSQNVNYPIGNVSTQEQRYLIRLIGQYDNLDEIRNTAIGTKAGVPVLIRDVADVNWLPEKKESYARLNGQNCVFIWVQRRPDANTVAVAKGVSAEVKKIKQTLPSGVKFDVFWDSSETIKKSIKNVLTNLILGGILSIMILFLFLRRFRATMFVAFAIPVSTFFALFFMYVFGFTVNILSMAGLAIAVGMIVDNSIVVFESIFRHREQGEEPIKAASEGTNTVAMAITASTLTTIAVFFPLLLLPGLIRLFFKELSWAIIFALTASLGVAFTLMPMLTSRYLKLPPPGFEEKGIRGWAERFYKKLENFYKKTIHWGLGHRKAIIIITLVMFLLSLGLIPFIGTEFMPEQETRHTEIFAEMPIGTNLEMTNRAISQLEKYIVEHWSESLDGLAVQIGAGATVWSAVFGGARVNSAEIDILLKKNAKHLSKEVVNGIRRQAAEIPGLVVRAGRTVGMAQAFGGGSPIQVDIIGYDIPTADTITKLVIATIETIPGIVDIKATRERGDPEIQLLVDRQKATLYGLSPYQIGNALRTQIEGNVVTKYRMKGKEYDILLRLKEEQRNEIAKILSTSINGPFGPVLLRNVVTVKTGTSPLQIEHKNNERIVSITANVIGQSAGRMGEKIAKIVNKIPRPPDFVIKVTGSYEEMQKTFQDLAFAVVLAIILVFMVMAAQFESFREPFIIIFTIPLAIIGVLWMLLITKTTLSIISGIGVLVLVGIVVNNGIVYIDYVNQLRRFKGMELEEAVKEAGRIRLRPILMTALTTIFGLIPLALGIGEGAELWSPLGRSVIGGLFVSTFLTLIFIPVLYTSFEKSAEKRRARRS